MLTWFLTALSKGQQKLVLKLLQDLKKGQLRIMATQDEAAAQANEVGAQLEAATLRLGQLTTKQEKIGTEVDKQNDRIRQLEEAINNGAVKEELLTALQRVKQGQESVIAELARTETAAQVVDDKNVDA